MNDRKMSEAALGGQRSVRAATYPRCFKLPSGRYVRARTLINALREIRKAPERDYQGWDWFPVRGDWIIREVLRGVDDRINRRKALSEATVAAHRREAAGRQVLKETRG